MWPHWEPGGLVASLDHNWGSVIGLDLNRGQEKGLVG